MNRFLVLVHLHSLNFLRCHYSPLFYICIHIPAFVGILSAKFFRIHLWNSALANAGVRVHAPSIYPAHFSGFTKTKFHGRAEVLSGFDSPLFYFRRPLFTQGTPQTLKHLRRKLSSFHARDYAFETLTHFRFDVAFKWVARTTLKVCHHVRPERFLDALGNLRRCIT